MMHPMYLRRKDLCKTHCRLVEVVRADWLPPWAAALRVELPEPRALEDIASFNGQLKPASAGSCASCLKLLAGLSAYVQQHMPALASG